MAAIDVKAIMREIFLADAGENGLTFPETLTFTLPLVVRSPHSWPLLFEDRSYGREDFTTVDGIPGPAARTFKEAARRVLSTAARAPYLLSADSERHLDELQEIYQAMGILFCVVPPPPDVAGVRASMKTLLIVLRPLILQARWVLGKLNANQLDEAGCSGSRYQLYQKVDPSNYPRDEQEAVKRATTRAEAPMERKPKEAKRPRSSNSEKPKNLEPRICTKCNTSFTGSYFEHKRKMADGKH